MEEKNIVTDIHTSLYIHYQEGFNGTNYEHEIEYWIQNQEITIKYAKQFIEKGRTVKKHISDEHYIQLLNIMNKYYDILSLNARSNSFIVFDAGHDSFDYQFRDKRVEDASLLFAGDDRLCSIAYREYREILEMIFKGNNIAKTFNNSVVVSQSSLISAKRGASVKPQSILTEYRTLPRYFGGRWFKTEETTKSDETYSCVFIADENGNYLYENGYNVLVIGCNPRGGDYVQEIVDYENAKKANPGLKHRERVNGRILRDALEPFRRTPIYKICEINQNECIKKLIAWDMFVYRTQTADDLFTAMRSNSNDVNTFKKNICGVENFNRLQSLLKKESFDYIVLSWGDCWNGVANNANIKECVQHYLSEIKEAIGPYKDKCYCYGITSSGNPKHEQARGIREFRSIDQQEYNAIFTI